MRLVFAVAAIALAMVSGAHAEAPKWQVYQPKDGGFRIDMPGEPILKTTARKSGGDAYSALVSLDKSSADADMVFLVKYAPMDRKPGPVTAGILDTVVKSMTEGGKLLSEKKEMLGGYPAERFAIEDADKDTSELRSVITDHQFIQVIYLGPPGNPMGKRFLDSFAIVKP